FHRHINTHEIRHLIAPSSMLELEPTSIHSSSQKGMRAQHPRLSRSRRDTPSSWSGSNTDPTEYKVAARCFAPNGRAPLGSFPLRAWHTNPHTRGCKKGE